MSCFIYLGFIDLFYFFIYIMGTFELERQITPTGHSVFNHFVRHGHGIRLLFSWLWHVCLSNILIVWANIWKPQDNISFRYVQKANSSHIRRCRLFYDHFMASKVRWFPLALPFQTLDPVFSTHGPPPLIFSRFQHYVCSDNIKYKMKSASNKMCSECGEVC